MPTICANTGNLHWWAVPTLQDYSSSSVSSQVEVTFAAPKVGALSELRGIKPPENKTQGLDTGVTPGFFIAQRANIPATSHREPQRELARPLRLGKVIGDHFLASRYLSKQLPTPQTNITTQYRITILRQPNHVVFAIPYRMTAVLDQLIKAARLERGMSQVELAERVIAERLQKQRDRLFLPMLAPTADVTMPCRYPP